MLFVFRVLEYYLHILHRKVNSTLLVRSPPHHIIVEIVFIKGENLSPYRFQHRCP